MILVIHSAVDGSAERLTDEWGGRAIALTPLDFGREGWALSLPPTDRDRVVAGGEQVGVAEIDRVLVLLHRVPARELVHLAPEHRPYAAAEATATLRFLLDGLGARVAVPPAPESLAGPLWSEVRCRRVLEGLGVDPSTPADTVPTPAAPEFVAVVDGVVSGASSGRRADIALRLVTASGLSAAGVLFRDGHTPAGLSAIPPLGDAAVRQRLRETVERVHPAAILEGSAAA